MRSVLLCWVFTLLACFGRVQAWAQDTAAEEAAHRAMAIAQFPPGAAQVLFGRESMPATGPPQAIGSYVRGCLSGAIALPADGPNWQVMRPSRNRAWGHPVLIAFLERLARKLPGEAGWPGLLVGDIARSRAGPMLTGHGSHQIGLDVDIWLTPMPNRRLSLAERDGISATDVVAGDGMDIDPTAWTPDADAYRRPVEGGEIRSRVPNHQSRQRRSYRERTPRRPRRRRSRGCHLAQGFQVRRLVPDGTPRTGHGDVSDG